MGYGRLWGGGCNFTGIFWNILFHCTIDIVILIGRVFHKSIVAKAPIPGIVLDKYSFHIQMGEKIVEVSKIWITVWLVGLVGFHIIEV